MTARRTDGAGVLSIRSSTCVCHSSSMPRPTAQKLPRYSLPVVSSMRRASFPAHVCGGCSCAGDGGDGDDDDEDDGCDFGSDIPGFALVWYSGLDGRATLEIEYL